jgi:hypothetical protein
MSNGNTPVRRALPVDPDTTVEQATPVNPPPEAPSSCVSGGVKIG